MMKCICKKCEDCRLYLSWILTNDNGEQKVESRCAILTLAQELPRLRGSVDGLQSGVNEARNRAIETRESVEVRAGQFVDTLKAIAESNVKRIN
jgi:hypothetical protein